MQGTDVVIERSRANLCFFLSLLWRQTESFQTLDLALRLTRVREGRRAGRQAGGKDVEDAATKSCGFHTHSTTSVRHRYNRRPLMWTLALALP
ncbi:hypothetical protein Mapa_005488 [Marchantia paleacea]|nr:hypothetical protein Mapa_005488 [Marchantia paleacea]